jgi:hypothetical protein
MTRSSRYTPDSPEVAAILSGIWKSGVKTYYRIDADGKHIDVRIRHEMMAARHLLQNSHGTSPAGRAALHTLYLH